MNWIIITAYFLTVLIVLLPVTAILNSILGGILARLTKNLLIGMLLGSLTVWFCVSFLWIKFAEGPMPILAFGLCLLILVVHAYIKRNELNESAKFMIGGEQ